VEVLWDGVIMIVVTGVIMIVVAGVDGEIVQAVRKNNKIIDRFFIGYI